MHGILHSLRNAGFIIFENKPAPKVIRLPMACTHSDEDLIKTVFDGIRCTKCEPKWLWECRVCTSKMYECAC